MIGGAGCQVSASAGRKRKFANWNYAAAESGPASPVGKRGRRVAALTGHLGFAACAAAPSQVWNGAVRQGRPPEPCASSWEPATCCDRRPKQDFSFCHVKGQGEETNLVRKISYDITHARLVCWGVRGCLPGRWPPLSCVCGICCCEAPRTSCRCPPPRSSGDGGPLPPAANPGAPAALFSYACHLGLAWKAACRGPVWRRHAGRHVGGRHGASRPFQRAGRAWQAQRARRPRPRSAASS